jgi:hypothetical protein
VIHFSIDDLQNLKILLTFLRSYVEHCQMLSGNKSKLKLKLFFVLLQSSHMAFDIINWSLHPLLPGWHPFCSAGNKSCSSRCAASVARHLSLLRTYPCLPSGHGLLCVLETVSTANFVVRLPLCIFFCLY